MKKLFKNVLQFFFVSFLCGITQTAWAQTGKWDSYQASSLQMSDDQDTIYIYTAEDLALYAYGVNNDYKTSKGYYCGRVIELMADIDLSAHYWAPIGENKQHYFNGIFHGNGHVITGMKVVASYADGSLNKDDNYGNPRAGLFGHVSYRSSGPTCITDLVLKDFYVNLTPGNRWDAIYLGGLVGVCNAGTKSSITNCCLINGTVFCNVQNNAAIGGLVASGSPNECSNNYRYNVSVKNFSESIGTISGESEANCATLTVSGHGTATLGGNVGVISDGKIYAASGQNVTLSVTPDVGYMVNYASNDVTITDGTFTMPANDVSIAATFVPDPAHISVNDDGTEYTIHTAEGWGVFCDLLGNNDKGYFTGKTVKLGANITVSRMAGVRYHDFTGTFDGNKKTLTFNYGNESSPATEEYTAPFRYVEDGCTIKNLHVDGEIFTKAKYATGLIGSQYGAVSIENCRSSIVIHSTVINNDQNDGTHAGFVATNASSNGSKLTIEGCLFDGKMLTKANSSTSRCAGFVGWKNIGVTIKNCIYAPAAIADGETEVITGTGSNLSATFSRNGGTFTNCFYTRTLGTVQGKASLSVTAGKNVTVSNIVPVGEVKNTYDVSGITAYNMGLSYGNKFYYGNGDDVNLTLSHSTTPEGYSFDGYTASSGTLVGTQNPYTLTMSNDNVTINASFSENVLTLDDASDNSKDIYYAANGGLVYKTVTLSGRTLYKDGAWNTLCLPFDVKLSESVLSGAKARKLTAASVKGSTFNLTFSDEVTELEAGVPYIIKWESGEDITNPVFNNVTVDATDRSFNNGVSGDGRVRFIGTNNTVSFTDDDNALLMGAENTLYYVNAGACIRANRAYFRIGDDDVYCARRITSFNIDFSDETTGISGNCRVDDVDSSWFTLQGVKLADKPTQNGVYIHNGKKVVIK